MIRLNSTQTLQAKGVVQAVVSYSDKTTDTYSGATQIATLAGAVYEDICAAAPVGTQRDIDYCSLHNFGVVDEVVVVALGSGGQSYTMFTGVLTAGRALVYTHANGWVVPNDGTDAATSGGSGNLPTGLITVNGDPVTVNNDYVVVN